MNKFELISVKEYEKTVAEEFKAKNGVLSYQSYDELKVPCRATQGSAGYDFFSPISFKLSGDISYCINSDRADFTS